MAQRLIDANALETTYIEGWGAAYSDLKIDLAPTIDPLHALGACYCGECEFWDREVWDGCKYNWGKCNKVLDAYSNPVLTTQETDFCSRGEPKNNLPPQVDREDGKDGA